MEVYFIKKYGFSLSYFNYNIFQGNMYAVREELSK